MVKKAVTWLAIGFAVYVLIATPDRAADAVRTAFDGIIQAGTSVLEFFTQLWG